MKNELKTKKETNEWLKFFEESIWKLDEQLGSQRRRAYTNGLIFTKNSTTKKRANHK